MLNHLDVNSFLMLTAIKHLGTTVVLFTVSQVVKLHFTSKVLHFTNFSVLVKFGAFYTAFMVRNASDTNTSSAAPVNSVGTDPPLESASSGH